MDERHQQPGDILRHARLMNAELLQKGALHQGIEKLS
jgi:hypothetical protein